MSIWEIALIGIALAMDACAVGMTDGMAEPRMSAAKALLIAGTFALFQAGMPLLGYYCGAAFSSLVAKIAPYLSFAVLTAIGGKSAVEYFRGRGKRETFSPRAPLGAGKLLVQAVATSIDALAVGVTLLAAETEGGLPFHVLFCAAVIGAVTFVLSAGSVLVGKKAGDALAGKAELAGGIILIAIGVKLLLEGVL